MPQIKNPAEAGLFVTFEFSHKNATKMLYPELDDILACLDDFYIDNRLTHRPHSDIRNALARKHSKPPSDLVMLLEYLNRTGMVHKNDNGHYLISYEGKVLLDDGGYAKQKARKAQSDFNLKTRNILLPAGSSITALYALWKLYSHFGKTVTIEFATFLFVFLAGLLSGVIIYILISGVQQKTNQR